MRRCWWLPLLLLTLEASSFSPTGPWRGSSSGLFSTEDPKQETSPAFPDPDSDLATTSSSSQSSTSDLEAFVGSQFPSFHSLLSINQGVWGKIAEASACTIFCPTEEAFEKLGEKRRLQLRDVRNEEVAQKIGKYHVVLDDAISAARLRTEDWTVPAPSDGSPRPITISGLVTMVAEVPVGRTKSGGVFGLFAKEDGDICVGPNARIQKSYKLGTCIVHEMDDFINPVILWRYCDQLKIGF